MLIVIILTGIALVFGILIYIVNRTVPTKVEGIEKTEEIAGILPGMNCGACGYPGCFAFAQALTANPELITENVNGFLVPHNNPEEMARAISLVFSDPLRMERLGKAGRKKAAKEFSVETMVHKYNEVYQTFLSKRHGKHTAAFKYHS